MVQERPNRIERRLSAILAADLTSYSRLMHNDEEATHARLTMLLMDAVEPSIAQHGGRIAKKIPATGSWQNFENRTVEAVRAAMQFQERVNDLGGIRALTRGLAPVRRRICLWWCCAGNSQSARKIKGKSVRL
jgi:class 3 adenylate cyclase